MIELLLTRHETIAVARAMKSVAMIDDAIDRREQDLLAGVASLLSPEDAASLSPIEPDELAATIGDPRQREGLMQRLVMMTMLDGHIDPKEIELLRRYAEHLGVGDRAIDQMQLFAEGHIKRLAFDLFRSGFLGKRARTAYDEEGLRGIWKFVKSARGGRDAETEKCFAALASHAQGTFGRALYDYYGDNEFPLPGAKDGVPAILLFHDVGHVISGYGTDPAGEVQMAGFEGGYMKDDGFSVVLLALFLFQLGAPLPGTQPAKDAFEVEPFHDAYARGRALATDLRGFDIWPHMGRPLAEVQTELCAPPPS